MNSLFLKFDDGTDTNIVFTKLKELFPSVKKAENIESVVVLKEFTELAYKDHEMDVKFEFNVPHTIKMTYQGDKWVSVDDEEFNITLGNKTEDEAMLDYICYLDFMWDEYVDNTPPNKMSKGLIEKIDLIKSKMMKIV